MRRALWITAFLAIIVGGLIVTQTDADARLKASPVKLAPPVPCTAKNRMDVFIDEDNIMYECQCQMLKSTTLCAWWVIGGVDAVKSRKLRRARHVWRVKAYSVPPLLVRVR